MTIQQVDGDGAGPYHCGTPAGGSGQTFGDDVLANTLGQVPLPNAEAAEFALVAQMPA